MNDDQRDIIYSTADICDMYGFSASGLRFLEDKGIIAPRRESKNRYRIFTLRDCSRIFNSRILRQYQFSMDAVTEMMGPSSLDTYLSRFEAQRAALEDELAYKQKLLASMNQRLALLKHLKEPRPYRMVTTAPMLRLNLLSKKGKASVANAEQFQKWFGALPFTAASLQISRETLREESPEKSFGFIIEEEQAAANGLLTDPNTTLLPAMNCLYTYLDFDDDLHDFGAALAPVMQRLDAMHLRLNGDPFTRMLGCLNPGRGMRRLDEAWFPVEN